MHWGAHVFGLPRLPKGMGWHVALNSDAEECNGIYRAGTELPVENPKKCVIGPHSIVVFISKMLPQTEDGDEGV